MHTYVNTYILGIIQSVYTKEGRLVLGKMLQRNTTLKTFYIADYRLSEIIPDVAEELKHNSILETVEFEGIFIDDIGFKLLAEIISYNKHVKTLVLKVFDRYLCTTDDLIEALKHNSTLQHFSLHGVILTVPQLELLANALTINTTLEKLEYESESVSKAKRTALTERLWASGVLHQLLTIALENNGMVWRTRNHQSS